MFFYNELFLSDINLQNTSLVQEFIKNPFLIDGRKFSISIFVMFTSANPLRAYVEENIVELRFSPKFYDADKLHDDPAMYITDGMEFGFQFIRQVS